MVHHLWSSVCWFSFRTWEKPSCPEKMGLNHVETSFYLFVWRSACKWTCSSILADHWKIPLYLFVLRKGYLADLCPLMLTLHLDIFWGQPNRK
jgi:hypothetical protein